MAFTVSTWTPASLQLRLGLNYGSFRAPVKVKMVKPSRRCVAQNAESDRDLGGWNDLDSSSEWSDSGDDEKNSNSRGGFWFKGANIEKMVANQQVSSELISDGSSDQISTVGDEGNNTKDQDSHESYTDSPVLSRDDIDVESKTVSTGKENCDWR